MSKKKQNLSNKKSKPTIKNAPNQPNPKNKQNNWVYPKKNVNQIKQNKTNQYKNPLKPSSSISQKRKKSPSMKDQLWKIPKTNKKINDLSPTLTVNHTFIKPIK